MIETKSISCGYTEKNILADLDLKISQDEFAVLIGPNGAGKSTLLYCLMGFLPLRGGSISIKEKKLGSYRRLDLARIMAYVPQETGFLFDYPVQEVILMGRYPWLKFLQTWSAEDKEIVARVMTQLGLDEFKERWFSQLSGGEKQRVLLARALVQDTDFIFLDETLSQLDINHQIETMQLLRDIRDKHHKGIFLISHNLNLAANYADRIIFLKAGRIIAEGHPDSLIEPSIMKEVFSVELQTQRNPVSGRMNIIYP